MGDRPIVIRLHLPAQKVALSGLVVVCLPLDPRFSGSNLAEDDGVLRAIKIPTTASFGEEVKSSIPYRKISGVLNNPTNHTNNHT
jgi:hypothetical protein